MKNNIKEDLETEYLKQELINDNTLLLYEQVDDSIYVKMRFIERNKINEVNITILSVDEYNMGDRVRINEDKTALAVFRKISDMDVLTEVYDLETHYCGIRDFLDCEYNLRFSDQVDECLRLVKKK